MLIDLDFNKSYCLDIGTLKCLHFVGDSTMRGSTGTDSEAQRALLCCPKILLYSAKE
jgi:hypothetical protein